MKPYGRIIKKGIFELKHDESASRNKKGRLNAVQNKLDSEYTWFSQSIEDTWSPHD